MINLEYPPTFATLTYPGANAPTPDEYRAHRRRLGDRFRRQWRGVECVWFGRLGWHKSGVPHIHALVYGIQTNDVLYWLSGVWPEVSETATLPHVEQRLHAEPARSARGSVLYLAKPDEYAPADPHGLWGRRWWKWGDPEPFRSEVITADLPDRVAYRIHRYMRRYLGIRARAYPSLSAVCDPGQWGRLLALELEQNAALTRDNGG